MPPFFQFRLWLREGPTSERVLTAIASAVVLLLVVVALVPVANDNETPTALDVGGQVRNGPLSSRDTSTPGGDAPASSDSSGADGSATRGGGAVGGSAGAAASGNGAGTPTPSATQCEGRAASGPGVTAGEVLVDVSLISLAGPIGNSLFDIRPDLRDIANALADEINKTGGVACGRKLRMKLYDVNPLDTNDAQAKCLQMVEDKPYLVLDFGGYLGQATRACFVQNKLPIVSSVAFGEAEFKSSFPFVVSPRNSAESQARNAIQGLAARGFFAKPNFKKLGLLVENCLPSVAKLIDQQLAAVGVTANEISKFTLDCNPASGGGPISQAVLQHKAADVSHVFLATAANNGQSYTRTAAQQGLRPRYAVSDLGEATTPSGAKNWNASFDNAIGITSTHVGETFSGQRNAKVNECDAIMKRHGVNGFTTEAKDLALISLCDLFDFFRAAINKAGTNPVRTGFVNGIAAIGDFPTAAVGDGVFKAADDFYGDDFQRAVQYHADCTCWKVADAFKPAFTG